MGQSKPDPVQTDAEWQRKITKRLVTVLDRIIGETESLQRRLQQPFTPEPGSVFAQQAPRPDDLPRHRLWTQGLGELHVKIAVALDATRAIRSLAKTDAGIVISPLILSRTILETMVDTRAYLGGKPHLDRTLRFYGSIARDVNREINPLKWKDENFDSLTPSGQKAWEAWDRVQADAELAGYRLDVLPGEGNARDFNLAVIGRDGKRVSCEPKTATALANIDRQLLQVWNMTSGMAHGARWIAGTELQHATDGTSRGMPWINAVWIIAECLGRICDDNAEFFGRAGGYRDRFLEEFYKLAPLIAQASVSNPGDGLWTSLVTNVPKA